jgi:cytoskeleton protein RodZ
MAESGAIFGAELRSERERRGISLEKMCAETKLNPRYLSALEQGDFKALPGGVFRRGVVRAYLSAVGLAEHIWMPRFDSTYATFAGTNRDSLEKDDSWVTFAVNVKRNRGVRQSRNLKRWLGVLALFLILVGAGWAVWHYLLQGALRH